MGKHRKYMRTVQKKVLTGNAADTIACWLPIVCTCFLVVCRPKGFIPFLQWTIQGKDMAILSLVMLAPWGIYQMMHEYTEEPVDQWLKNILPVEGILWLVYCRMEHDQALVFLLGGTLGAGLWAFGKKKDWKRYAAMAMAIALTAPACYAVRKEITGMRIVAWTGDSAVQRSEKREMDKCIPQCNDEKWKEMDFAERLDLLRGIAAYETQYMGIPDVAVYAEKLNQSEEITLTGKYDANRNEILIDATYLSEADYWECVNTALHECRHAMQHHVVEKLLDWKDENVQNHIYYMTARQWKASFENRKEDENFEAYFQDPVETDARAYAEERVYAYYEGADE